MNQKNSILQLFRIKQNVNPSKKSVIYSPESVSHLDLSNSNLIQETHPPISANQKTYHDIVSDALQLMEKDSKKLIDIQEYPERSPQKLERAGIDRLLKRDNPFKPITKQVGERHLNLPRFLNKNFPPTSEPRQEYPFETNTWNKPIDRISLRASSQDQKKVRYHLVKKHNPGTKHFLTDPAPPITAQPPGEDTLSKHPGGPSDAKSRANNKSNRIREIKMKRLANNRKSRILDYTV